MKIITYAFFILLSLLILSCDEKDDNTTNPDVIEKGDQYRLYVKFVNMENSKYEITSIQYINAGLVMNGLNPEGAWSNNLLKNNQKLKAGAAAFFFVNVPRQYWALCRIGVYDSTAKRTIYINDQQGFSDYWIKPTITHWGGDERTVKVTLEYLRDEKIIAPTHWSDWVGIEK